MTTSVLQIFDKNYAGRVYIAPAVYSKSGYGFVSASVDSNSMSVVLSGWYETGRSGKWLQTTSGYWIIESESRSVGNTIEQHSDKDAQKLINGIIKNDKRIYENNLLCAGCASRLTQEQRDSVRELQKRLEQRDAALRNSALIQSAQESYPAGYITYAEDLDRLVSGVSGAVGVVISSTALVVISAVVLAAVSTAAYYAYKSYYEESLRDVKFSDELTASLVAKLTPEEYERLKQETAGLLTKAKITERFAGAGNLIKYALLGIGSYMLYSVIKDKYNSKNK